MALDPNYIVASDLEEYFVDKDTGAPLSKGIVTFYKDQARTELKPVFMITGSPPNYTYTEIWNPVTLSAVGTFQDADGNNIVPYYYPFDADGNTELYYITVYSSLDGITPAVLQFTREGWPNFTEGADVNANSVINYVPNGQFLARNNIPATETTEAGEITSATTILAQGGWHFERPNTSTATDIVTFSRFNAYVSNPTASPRYGVRIKNEVPSPGDAYKALRIIFNDVNKFASTTQFYTFSFTAVSNGAGNVNVDIDLFKNFGAGGSASTTTILDTETITTSYSIINVPFLFGNNVGKTIGADDDDYVAIDVRFPVNATFDVTLTDFILTTGNVNISGFPQTTNADFLTRGVAGWMPTPDPDGTDLYLPLVLTKSGLTFDRSQIAKVYAGVHDAPRAGELLCDGTQYLVDGFSIEGIPYSRLHDIIGSRFGTGLNYFTLYNESPSVPTQFIRLTNNSAGAVTATANGGIATPFTFSTRHTGANYGVKSYIAGSNFDVIGNAVGKVTNAAVGTSGFTITMQVNSPYTYMIFRVLPLTAAGLAGLYFTFSTTTTDFYVWFKVDGVGVDPAPGGTGILVNLRAVNGADDVARITREAINGSQQTLITCTAASTITAGSYFIANSTTTGYYIWFEKAGIGTDPAVGGRTGIKVSLTGSETATQVATATLSAVNNKYFAVPDYRGMFLRGVDGLAGWDLDEDTRWSDVSTLSGDRLGTFEFGASLSHQHNVSVRSLTDPGSDDSGLGAITYGGSGDPNKENIPGNQINSNDGLGAIWANTLNGGNENRPINTYVNWFIKY